MVPNLRVCFDADGAYYINNIRVNGIAVAPGVNPWFVLGVLNAPVSDFVFRRIAAPKGGGYFEANKQYIVPLPVPHCEAARADEIGHIAQSLQTRASQRREVLDRIKRRLSAAT